MEFRENIKQKIKINRKPIIKNKSEKTMSKENSPKLPPPLQKQLRSRIDDIDTFFSLKTKGKKKLEPYVLYLKYQQDFYMRVVCFHSDICYIMWKSVMCHHREPLFLTDIRLLFESIEFLEIYYYNRTEFFESLKNQTKSEEEKGVPVELDAEKFISHLLNIYYSRFAGDLDHMLATLYSRDINYRDYRGIGLYKELVDGFIFEFDFFHPSFRNDTKKSLNRKTSLYNLMRDVICLIGSSGNDNSEESGFLDRVNLKITSRSYKIDYSLWLGNFKPGPFKHEIEDSYILSKTEKVLAFGNSGILLKNHGIIVTFFDGYEYRTQKCHYLILNMIRKGKIEVLGKINVLLFNNRRLVRYDLFFDDSDSTLSVLKVFEGIENRAAVEVYDVKNMNGKEISPLFTFELDLMIIFSFHSIIKAGKSFIMLLEGWKKGWINFLCCFDYDQLSSLSSPLLTQESGLKLVNLQNYDLRFPVGISLSFMQNNQSAITFYGSSSQFDNMNSVCYFTLDIGPLDGEDSPNDSFEEARIPMADGTQSSKKYSIANYGVIQCPFPMLYDRKRISIPFRFNNQRMFPESQQVFWESVTLRDQYNPQSYYHVLVEFFLLEQRDSLYSKNRFTKLQKYIEVRMLVEFENHETGKVDHRFLLFKEMIDYDVEYVEIVVANNRKGMYDDLLHELEYDDNLYLLARFHTSGVISQTYKLYLLKIDTPLRFFGSQNEDKSTNFSDNRYLNRIQEKFHKDNKLENQNLKNQKVRRCILESKLTKKKFFDTKYISSFYDIVQYEFEPSKSIIRFKQKYKDVKMLDVAQVFNLEKRPIPEHRKEEIEKFEVGLTNKGFQNDYCIEVLEENDEERYILQIDKEEEVNLEERKPIEFLVRYFRGGFDFIVFGDEVKINHMVIDSVI